MSKKNILILKYLIRINKRLILNKWKLKMTDYIDAVVFGFILSFSFGPIFFILLEYLINSLVGIYLGN